MFAARIARLVRAGARCRGQYCALEARGRGSVFRLVAVLSVGAVFGGGPRALLSGMANALSGG